MATFNPPISLQGKQVASLRLIVTADEHTGTLSINARFMSAGTPAIAPVEHVPATDTTPEVLASPGTAAQPPSLLQVSPNERRAVTDAERAAFFGTTALAGETREHFDERACALYLTNQYGIALP